MIGSLLTFFAVGLVTIIAAIVVLGVIGSVIGFRVIVAVSTQEVQSKVVGLPGVTPLATVSPK